MRNIIAKLFNLLVKIAPVYTGKKAFELMCRVQRTKVDMSPDPFLDQAIETKFYIENYEATLYKLGTGSRKLLFLHGWKSYSTRWEKMVSHINLDQFTVYMLDAPAHGRSRGDHLHLEIYRKFLMKSIGEIGELDTLITHSLGGLITAYAYTFNNKLPIRQYIITGAPYGMISIYAYFQRVLGVNDKVITAMDDYIDENITQMKPVKIHLENFFNNVQEPLLIIHDEGDRICPITDIHKANHKAEHPLTITTGLGHDLQGPEYYKVVLDFLE